jgi:hypothetical protein
MRRGSAMRTAESQPDEIPFAVDIEGAVPVSRGPAAEDRVPPCDLDAERAVLSAAIVLDDGFEKVRNILRPEHFSSGAHAWIFEACVEVASFGRPDPVRVAAWLKDRGRLAQIGGMAHLTELLNAAPVATNLAAYANIVRDKYRAREAIRVCQRIAAEGYAGHSVDALIPVLAATVDSLQASAEASDSLSWVSAADIFAPLPAPTWVVPELFIGPGRPTLIAGYGFSAKTLGVQSLALAVAAGKTVWGHFGCGEGLRVRHLDYEQGRTATLRRYQRLALGAGLRPSDLGDRLEVTIFPDLYLTDIRAQDRFAWACEGVALCIIDALRGALPGVDENDSAVRGYIDNLSRVSERTGTAFAIVHHAGKPRDGHADARTMPRGSSAIFDACGCVLVLTGAKDEPKLVRMEKTPADAEGRAVEDFYLAVEDVAEGDKARAGLRVAYQTKEQAKPPGKDGERFTKLKAQVVDLVRGNHELTSGNAICARVRGGNKSDKLQAIRELLDEGRLVQPGGERSPYRVGQR